MNAADKARADFYLQKMLGVVASVRNALPLVPPHLNGELRACLIAQFERRFPGSDPANVETLVDEVFALAAQPVH